MMQPPCWLRLFSASLGNRPAWSPFFTTAFRGGIHPPNTSVDTNAFRVVLPHSAGNAPSLPMAAALHTAAAPSPPWTRILAVADRRVTQR